MHKKSIRVFLVLFTILLSLNLIEEVKADPEHEVIYYASGNCGCITAYFKKIKTALSNLGINDFKLVRDPTRINKATKQLYQNLNVPSELRGRYILCIDDKFLFMDEVRVEFVADFVENHSHLYSSIVVYRNILMGGHQIMFENGLIVSCENKYFFF